MLWNLDFMCVSSNCEYLGLMYAKVKIGITKQQSSKSTDKNADSPAPKVVTPSFKFFTLINAQIMISR